MTFELPEGWHLRALEDCGTWLSGGTPSRKNDAYWDGDIPWISAKSLTDFYIRDSDRHVTELGAQNGARIAPAGSTIFLVRGMSLQSEFRMGIARRDVTFNQDCKAIVPREGIDPVFLANAVRARTPQILGMVDSASHGTGRLATDRIAQLRIAVPPIEEQRAIAEVIGALDDRIEHLSTEAGLYDAMMQAAYQQLAVEETARVMLGDVIEVNPTTPLRRGSEAPYFDMASLPERGFLPDSPAMRPYGSGMRFVAGDVLLARITPCLENGKTAIVPPLEGDVAWGSTEFIVMRANRQARGLVYGLSRTPDFRDYAVQHMSGSSGRQRVKADDIARYRVPDFTSPAATRIGTLAADWIEAGMAVRDQIETLASLREALLPRLLLGELRIEDPSRLVGTAV